MIEENKAEPMSAKETSVYWSNKWESSMVENDRLRLELAALRERIKNAPCDCCPAAPVQCSMCELRAALAGEGGVMPYADPSSTHKCLHPAKKFCQLCGERFCPNDGCDPNHMEGCREANRP